MEPIARVIRPPGMRSVLLAALLVAATTITACGSGGGAPSAGSGGSPAPATVGPILGAADAAAAVASHNPLFSGIEQRNPDLIGQGSYWEATPLEAAKPPVPWTVTYTIGWGDCPSGCIDRHTWTYQVGADGSVTLTGEDGSPLTDDVIARLVAAIPGTGVIGRALAGPTCPVERPGDPACLGRPVVGAVLHVAAADGTAAGDVTTTDGGWYRMTLAAGDYVLTATPVEGVMGTPGPLPFTVRGDAQTLLDVPYDTGIR